MIEFDHRGEVFQTRHLVRRGHGGEVIAQPGVGGGAVGRGQPVVGVAADDGVQVEPALPRVVVQQPRATRSRRSESRSRTKALRH